MSKELPLTIHDAGMIDKVMNQARELVTRGIVAGAVLVTLGRPKKSREQENKFNAMIDDIAKSVEMPHVGKSGRVFNDQKVKYSFDVWKAKLVDAFELELKEQGIALRKPSQTVSSLDGQRFITIRPSSTEFTKPHGAMFIEFLYAIGSELGAVWSDEYRVGGDA